MSFVTDIDFEKYSTALDLAQDGSTKRTVHYGLFKHLPGNRPLSMNHVKRLADSIATRDLSYIKPIIIDKNGVVIDGQHRIEALKMLNKEVHYLVMVDSENDDLIVLNNNTKEWRGEDYVNYFAKNGNVEYQMLDNLCKESGFSITVAATWMSDSGYLNREAFKNGSFICSKSPAVFRAFKQAVTIYDQCIKSGTIKSKKSNAKYLPQAIRMILISKYSDSERFIEKMSSHNSVIPLFASRNECLLSLVGIYNSKLRGGGKLVVKTCGIWNTLEREDGLTHERGFFANDKY